MGDVKKKKMRETLDFLSNIRGRHTELVTFYVPSEYNFDKAVSQIRMEQSTSQNIKSKTVRKNVTGALEKILQHLKLYKRTPPMGLALFSGNVSEKEGVADIQLWNVEPTEAIKTKMYMCGQTFMLDPLRDMIRERELYGLIVLDKSEAEIGLLKGKQIEVLKHLESIVPGKTKKGGWCVHEDTLMQLDDGRIEKIKNLGENKFLCYDLESFSQKTSKHNHFFSRESKTALEIKTIAPTNKIKTTPEHKFFILNETGIGEKSAIDIKQGDMLLGLRNSKINGNLKLDKNLIQLLGYILGDGNKDENRIVLSEAEKSVAEIYSKLAENSLGLNINLRERKEKGYWQVRIYGKHFLVDIEKDFPEVISTKRKDIPNKICMLKNDYLSCFIKGLYDAEGWVDKSAKLVGITMNSIDVIKKLHQIMLRFGIVGSLKTVKTKGSFAKKLRHCFVITDYNSLLNYSRFIGFSSKRKDMELKNALNKSKTSWVDQFPLNGRYALSLIRKVNMTTNDFPKTRMYFAGKRKISYDVFKKNILPKITKQVNRTGKGKEILNLLMKLVNSEIIAVRVKSNKKIKSSGLFYDLEVPKYQSFVANNLILHNSQARYARIREGMLNDFLKNVGDIASAKFLDVEELKGVIIGGPGPIKEQFFEGKFLNYKIKEKILGVVNTSYTGLYGLNEMLTKSEDLMAEASITKERKILDDYFDELGKASGLAVYGLEAVAKAIETGNANLVILSEGFTYKNVSLDCSCGNKETKIVKDEDKKFQECSKCKERMHLVDEKDITDELLRKAEDMGTKVELVSVHTPKGEQLDALGGIGAILRFKA